MAQLEVEFPARGRGSGHFQTLIRKCPHSPIPRLIQYYCFHPGSLCKQGGGKPWTLPNLNSEVSNGTIFLNISFISNNWKLNQINKHFSCVVGLIYASRSNCPSCNVQIKNLAHVQEVTEVFLQNLEPCAPNCLFF